MSSASEIFLPKFRNLKNGKMDKWKNLVLRLHFDVTVFTLGANTLRWISGENWNKIHRISKHSRRFSLSILCPSKRVIMGPNELFHAVSCGEYSQSFSSLEILTSPRKFSDLFFRKWLLTFNNSLESNFYGPLRLLKSRSTKRWTSEIFGSFLNSIPKSRLENLEEDDLEVIRRQRMEQLKKAQKDKIEMLSNGHGKYEEVSDEKEFFEATKKSDRVVCLFYLPGNFRCKIVDKHFDILARKHVGTRFIHINAEKAHFLTTRLNIRVIPTIAVIVVCLTWVYSKINKNRNYRNNKQSTIFVVLMSWEAKMSSLQRQWRTV